MFKLPLRFFFQLLIYSEENILERKINESGTTWHSVKGNLIKGLSNQHKYKYKDTILSVLNPVE